MIDILKTIISEENIYENEPMGAHCTFKTGGEARYFVEPSETEEAVALIEACSSNGIPFRVIGNGSNLLVKDEGYDGVIICLKGLNKITVSENVLVCDAGALMTKAANVALDNELTGLEFASGIPGTIGGGVYMNAGAYGGEISGVFVKADVLFKNEDGTFAHSVMSLSDMEFGYRKSAAAVSKGGIIILNTALSLKKGSYMEIKGLMLELNRKRAEKQPIDMPSAGSAFKRPEAEGLFASKLVDDAGLKGMSVGGAQVSEKHAGFIVNTGNATASDITELAVRVQEAVFNRFRVVLELEFEVL